MIVPKFVRKYFKVFFFFLMGLIFFEISVERL